MRDIRSELQERVNLCEEQIRAAMAQFEQKAQQLQTDMDHRVGELRSLFATLEKLMVFENSLAGNVVPSEAQPIPTLSDRIRAAGARA
jgi:hypothetical protein